MKHNQYLYKTLLLSIILGILPIIPVLGFSTNSFITNSFTTTTTTTKPINLISNISPVANLQSYTNTTTNNYSNLYVQNNNSVSSVSLFQSPVSHNSFTTTTTTTKPINLISNISPVANLQSYTNTTTNNNYITTYNPTHTNTNYIPQNNNYSTFYVNNNSITQLQSSTPNSLISSISSTISTFPNVVAYTSPISNINSFNTINLNTNTKTNIPDSTFSPNNTFNLLLNNNQLLTTNSQSSPSSLNSFQLFKPLDTTLYQDNTSLIANSSNEINDNTIKPQIAPKPDILKPNYLILVNKNSDKPLYDKYIADRKYDYNMKIVSLEEKGIENKDTPDKPIKSLLKQLYYNEFPKFKYAVFDENIAFSHPKKYLLRDSFVFSRYFSDADYWNLDDDKYYIPEFYMGRITRKWLNTNWINSSSLKFLEAIPIVHYDHQICTGSCVTSGVVDLSHMADALKKLAQSKSIDTKTMFEMRSSYEPNILPDIPLTHQNFIDNYKNFNLVLITHTLEPVTFDPVAGWPEPRKPHYFPETPIWIDQDKDKRACISEITSEVIFDYSAQYYDNIKRIGLTSMILGNAYFTKGSGIDPYLSGEIALNKNIRDFFYNHISFLYDSLHLPEWRDGQGLSPSWTAALRLIYENILQGKPISMALQDSFYQFVQKFPLYSSVPYWPEQDILDLFLFGPPETSIYDLIDSQPQIWYTK